MLCTVVTNTALTTAREEAWASNMAGAKSTVLLTGQAVPGGVACRQ
jgi:hypothetical protein